MLGQWVGKQNSTGQGQVAGNWSLGRKHGGDSRREGKGSIEMFHPQLC